MKKDCINVVPVTNDTMESDKREWDAHPHCVCRPDMSDAEQAHRTGVGEGGGAFGWGPRASRNHPVPIICSSNRSSQGTRS